MATTLASPELSITTVRTLAMDAVQKANSGHPGAPMGLAPVGLDPVHQAPAPRPLRPGLAGARPLRAVGRPRVDAALRAPAPDRLRRCPMDELKRFRQLGSETPGHPERGDTAGGGDHHRPARPGLRQRGGLRAGRGDAGRPLQPPRPRDRRAPHVVHLLGRRPDGGHLARVGLDRRLPRARAPDRDLRRQPHQPRRPHQPLVRRRHADPLRRLRLAGAAGGGRQRPGGDRRRPDRGRRARRAPDPDRLPHAHRLRLAEQAGQLGRPRVAARAPRRWRRPSASTAGRRTPSSWCPTRWPPGARR